MNDTPYQRDYLQIIGVLTAIGALVFGLVFASTAARHGVVPDRRSLLAAGVLAVLIIGGAGLARARLWGGALLATAYLGVAFWCLRVGLRGMHTMSLWRLASTFAAVALTMAPAILVVRWRRFLS